MLSNTKNKQYVSANELAEMLSITRASIYRFVKNNGMPAGVRLGSARRFSLKEINEWLQKQCIINTKLKSKKGV